MDIKAAVQFLRGKAKTYHINPGRIGITGSSAGAYLTAMTAVTPDDPEFTPRYSYFPGESTAVQACAPVMGVFDWRGRNSAYVGAADKTISPANSVRLNRALLAAGKSSQLLIVKDIPHRISAWTKPKAAPAIDKMIDFFDKELKKKP